MSDKEIMEWVSNLVRLDEVSRAYQRDKDWQPRIEKHSVAWKIDQKAREVRVGSEPTSVNNSSRSPTNKDEWKKDMGCYVCGKKGHFQAEC